MTTQLDHFETNLLIALREHVADRSSPANALPEQIPSSRRRTGRKPSRPLVGGIAAAGAAVVGVIFVPGLGPNPAYSVQEGNSGQITVEVNRFEDAAGLERALADHGIEAEITYVPDGGICAPGRYVPIDGRGIRLTLGADLFRIALAPGAVRDGETLVVDASLIRLPDSVDRETGIRSTDGATVNVDANVASGLVPACTPMAASN